MYGALGLTSTHNKPMVYCPAVSVTEGCFEIPKQVSSRIETSKTFNHFLARLNPQSVLSSKVAAKHKAKDHSSLVNPKATLQSKQGAEFFLA